MSNIRKIEMDETALVLQNQTCVTRKYVAYCSRKNYIFSMQVSNLITKHLLHTRLFNILLIVKVSMKSP
jgi:hypothetical protein